MAKRRGRKTNFSRYIKGNVNIDVGLSTLANKAATSGSSQQTVADTTRLSSVRATYTLSNFTAGVDQGPILCGLAHSDYSNAEIEAWIEQTDLWDLGNMVAKEISSRRIRMVGVFNTPETASLSSRLNDGRPIRTKLNWVLAEGDGLRVWAFNTGTVTLNGTTNSNLNVFGRANLWVM